MNIIDLADTIERFEEKWEEDEETGCWDWKGGVNGVNVQGPNKCYGYLKVNRASNEVVRAHRFSYEIHTGEIPSGDLVRHTCHNPACVNPAHLATGTYQDNYDDMIAAGRAAWQGEGATV